MNTTEIKLKDSDKKRFTLDDVHAIAIGTEEAGRDAFPLEWEELLPRLVMVYDTPPTYAFPEDIYARASDPEQVALSREGPSKRTL